MPFKQGINFRASPEFVTDGADEDYYIEQSLFGNATYPDMTAQGTVIGYEAGSDGNVTIRNRNDSNDPRLAGLHFIAFAPVVFRVDLPSPGTYRIRVAMGDASGTQEVDLDLYDDTTFLASLCSGTTSGANQFRDATNTEYSAADWPANNSYVEHTFATTACRFLLNPVGSGVVAWAHFYIEAVSGGGSPTVYPTDHSTQRHRPGRGPYSVGRYYRPREEIQWIRPTGSPFEIGIAGEFDSALGVGHAKTRSVGLVTETDSASALAAKKVKALGLNTENENAQAIGHSKSRALGLNTETESPFSIGRRKASTLGQPSETGSALSFGHTKRRTLGIASESDITMPMSSPGEIDQPVELVTETDEAFSIGRVKRRTCGLALEACSAFSFGHERARSLGLALETDSALAFVLPTPPVIPQLRVAFLDRHGRFAKDTADVTEIRVFRTDDPDEYTSMTAAAFKALPAAEKTALYQAGSAAGLIDTSHKSNA